VSSNVFIRSRALAPNKTLSVLAVTAALASALTACGGGSSSGPATADGAAGSPAQTDGTPVAGGQITFAVTAVPGCLDPQVDPADLTGDIQRNVLDSLVALAPDGSVKPWLAKSWKVSKDAKTYTFKLRDDVKFTDGTPFDAAAVKANLDRIADPATKSQFAVTLLGPYAGTTVVDPHTVRVRFKRGYSPFLRAASTAFLGFWSPKVLAKDPDALCQGGANAVGTGPFKEVEYTKGQSVELERNPDYRWGPRTTQHSGPAHLDHLSIVFQQEDAARIGALQSSQTDVAEVPALQLSSLEDSGTQIVKQPELGVPYSFFFNTSKPPFDDPRAREAVAKAIDIDGIVQSVYRGQYQRAWAPLTPPTFGYDASLEHWLKHDPARANRLLDELGYTQRDDEGYRVKDGQRLRVVQPFSPQINRESRDIVSQAVQADLKKVGIQMVIQPLDLGAYLTARNGNKYDMIGFSWGSSEPNILTTLFGSDSQFADGGANAAQIHDPQIDGWLQDAASTLDERQRKADYARIQEKLVHDYVTLPFYVGEQAFGLSDRVHGFSTDGNHVPDFYDAWVQ
jgi:peptide/nickel transport system substrate-binding protein